MGKGSYQWNGPAYRKAFEEAVKKRMRTACIYLSSQIKGDISQAGTLRYRGGRTKTGRFTAFRTVYNYTHSAPGNPPYKQSGRLRGSITWELVGLTGRVGSNMVYARALEQRMNRPYLTKNLNEHRMTLARILTRRIGPGELPAIKSNQFRSGVLGRGFGRGA